MGEQIESYSYNDHNTVDQPICDLSLRENDPIQGSSKWMSSKMRIMKKMLSSERILMNKPKDQTVQDIQDQHQSNQESSSSSNTNHGSITIRVCSDCNTTKTPLWRSGPHGPKSLCNACGIRAIRQRKARRDMAAEAVALSGTGGGLSPVASAQITKVRKEKRLDADCTMPFKKRCRFSKLPGAAQKKLPFDDMSIHQIFPKDERDAAISLMALSCDLIRS